jgi:dimethylglycine catabolism B
MGKKSKELIPPGLTYIADNIILKQNVLGAPGETRALWADNLDLPKQGETIFFAGCGYQYASGLESMMSLIRNMDKSFIGAELPMRLAGIQRKLGIDLASIYRSLFSSKDTADSLPLKAAVKILQKLDIQFAYLGEEEPCCGGILHYTGMKSDFTANAEKLRERFNSLGVKNVIGMVPSCTYTLARLIPQQIDNFNVNVKHFLEILAEGVDSLKLNFPGQAKVTYHDPCQLSRYYGLIEEPRKILNAINGIELIEPEGTNKEWSTCCGGGGGFEAVFPELSEILATNRVKELLDTGADIIVTHCPGCIMQLKDGLKNLKRQDVEVLDLAELVAVSLGD